MTPSMPVSVAGVFDGYPPRVRQPLLAVRALIFDTALTTPGVGALTETLKWGEPAYLTEATGSGSTIRLGWSARTPERCAVFFNCKTSLIPTFRAAFSDVLAFEGNRAIVFPVDKPLAVEPLAMCVATALTYHLKKRP